MPVRLRSHKRITKDELFASLRGGVTSVRTHKGRVSLVAAGRVVTYRLDEELTLTDSQHIAQIIGKNRNENQHDNSE